MTTWTAGNKDRNVRDTQKLGNSVSQSYTITVVSGDTGGTLTVDNMRTLDNFTLRGWRETGPTALVNLLGYISGNTVVVAHDNPGEAATVNIKVWGTR
jgi:hypothetical protein